MGLLRRRLVHNFVKFTTVRITSEIQILSQLVTCMAFFLLASGVITVQNDMEKRSRIHCCRKAISMTYYQCVLVALGIQHAMRMRLVLFVICGLSGFTIFL